MVQIATNSALRKPVDNQPQDIEVAALRATPGDRVLDLIDELDGAAFASPDEELRRAAQVLAKEFRHAMPHVDGDDVVAALEFVMRGRPLCD
jgi:hypothetical protein